MHVQSAPVPIFKIYDPQRESIFNNLASTVMIALNQKYNTVFSFAYGEGPKQFYEGDCGIVTLSLIQRLLSSQSVLTPNSKKGSQKYKKIIVDTLKRYTTDG